MAPVLRAGFYYKTFMWPAAFWEKLYEPLICAMLRWPSARASAQSST
jgi:NADPH-dependent 2,4-dienoyl-CoA reductase/sulfur reductase-like enzyme